MRSQGGVAAGARDRRDESGSTVDTARRVEGFGLSPKDAATRVGVEVTTVRRAIRRGDLPASRPRGTQCVRIRIEDLEEWAFGDRVQPDPPRGRWVAQPERRAGSTEAGSLDRLRSIEAEARAA
jgi:excisionase family DNA binding protein